MNLRQIEFALAVAEEENFTRAAERCHTVQSALSHQIARLEAELGMRLFERNSRQVMLTPAGRVFVTHAKEVHDATRKLLDNMATASGETRGTLTIGMISTQTPSYLLELLARYHSLYPQVDIRFRHELSSRLLQAIRNQEMDFAFLVMHPDEPLSDLCSTLLSKEQLVALMPPNHPLAQDSALYMAQLADYTFVDYPPGTVGRVQNDEVFAAAGLERNVKFEVNHGDLLVEIVRQGLAIGLVPSNPQPWFHDLIQVPVIDSPARWFYLVNQRHLSPAAEAFQTLLAAQLQSEEGDEMQAGVSL